MSIFLCECLEALGEAFERENGFFLCLAIAQDGGALQRLLAPHDEEIGAIAALGEMKLFGERFNTDVLRQRDASLTKIFGKFDREPLRFVADMDE